MLDYNQKYLIFDTETEGLNLIDSRPWQISWMLAEGSRIVKVKDEYLHFPDLRIGPDVQRITKFSWTAYNMRKRSPKEVWAEFKQDLFNDKYIIVGQNLLGYDVYILAILQQLLGEKPDYSYMDRIYDTRCIGKAFRENLAKPQNSDMLSWQYKIMHDRTLKSKASQLQLLKTLGIDFVESKLHDAAYDNEMCFKVFCELKKRMGL